MIFDSTSPDPYAQGPTCSCPSIHVLMAQNLAGKSSGHCPIHRPHVPKSEQAEPVALNDGPSLAALILDGLKATPTTQED